MSKKKDMIFLEKEQTLDNQCYITITRDEYSRLKEYKEGINARKAKLDNLEIELIEIKEGVKN